MTEEEFEDQLGVKYGWGEPMGEPRWPLIIPFCAWVVMLIIVGCLAVHLSGCSA